MAGNDEDKFLPQEQWPHTVDEAVGLLLAKLSDADREELKHTSEAGLLKSGPGNLKALRSRWALPSLIW